MSTMAAHDRTAATTSSTAFSCERMAVEYERDGMPTRRILEDIDFDMPEGEFVSILGGSGVGKSTLLRVLGGLHPVNGQSKVTYRGQPISGPPRGVVVVFQDYGSSLLPWRTVERNVALGLEGCSTRAEIRQKVDDALRLVNLTASAKDRPWQLSGGMQQRVQIARALVTGPTALLMDEPFGALDAMTRSALQDALIDIHRQAGMTIVFVTHDVDEALYLSQRVIVLSGKPATVGLDVRTDLPPERDQLTTRELPRYLELRHLVFNAIESAGHD